MAIVKTSTKKDMFGSRNVGLRTGAECIIVTNADITSEDKMLKGLQQISLLLQPLVVLSLYEKALSAFN